MKNSSLEKKIFTSSSIYTQTTEEDVLKQSPMYSI